MIIDTFIHKGIYKITIYKRKEDYLVHAEDMYPYLEDGFGNKKYFEYPFEADKVYYTLQDIANTFGREIFGVKPKYKIKWIARRGDSIFNQWGDCFSPCSEYSYPTVDSLGRKITNE